MDEIVNKLLLAGDKFMPKIPLKQLGLTYSACWPFTKNKERIPKFKERGDLRYIWYIYMAYADFKDLAWRTVSDKPLNDEVLNIAKDIKYDGYQRRVASLVYAFFDKTSSGRGC